MGALKLVTGAAVFIILMSITFSPVVLKTKAHAAGVRLSSYMHIAPTIDGFIDAVEWGDSANISFTLLGGPGGKGTLYIENDLRNIYIAIQLKDTTLDYRILFFQFDNDHDDVVEAKEDELGYGGTFTDNYVETILSFSPDMWNGGTDDIVGAARSDGNYNYFEMSHPLCSGDMLDISVGVGQSIGFELSYGPGGFWPQNPDVYPLDNASNWGDITIAAPSERFWSSDSSGTPKDVFKQGITVYSTGDCFESNEVVTVFVVPNGGPYTALASLFSTSAIANAQGTLDPVSLGTYSPGKYDIWVDRNGNGVLDPITEPVDTYGEVPGFLVVPEYVGTILGLVGCFASLGVFRVYKRKHL